MELRAALVPLRALPLTDDRLAGVQMDFKYLQHTAATGQLQDVVTAFEGLLESARVAAGGGGATA
jgi:hypothetical protein